MGRQSLDRSQITARAARRPSPHTPGATLKTLGIAADFVLIILAGLIGGLAARALRLPLMVGYVAAGVLVGPNTAGPTVVQCTISSC